MRLRLDTLPALAEQIPALTPDAIRRHGRKHVSERQQYLAELIEAGYQRRRAHKSQRQAVSFSSRELQRGLRASKQSYPRLIEPLFRFESRNQGYSKNLRSTKAYELRADVEQAAKQVFEGDAAIPIRDRDTGALVGAGDLPTNGLPSNAGLSFSVPVILPVNVAAVDRAIERLRSWQDTYGYDWAPLNPDKPDGMTLQEATRLLFVTRQWVNALGGLPNTYQVQRSGRLGPADPLAPHVLALPSVLRRLLLHDSGLADFDLRSAFWSLYFSAGRSHGYSTEVAEAYLKDRDGWHSRLSQMTCRSGRTIKAVLLSFLCGGTLSSSSLTESGQLLGRTGMAAFAKDTAVRALYHEARDGIARLVSNAPRDDGGYILNAVGLPLPAEAATLGQAASHQLVGLEQLVIRSMADRVTALHGLCYDGFIARPQDSKALERHARETSRRRLGYSLNVELKQERFTLPVDPTRDPGDF